MSHALPALQVVVGTIIALLMYAIASSADYLTELLFFGAMLAIGLFVAVHGLFRGFESAVATATAPDEDAIECSNTSDQ